MATTLRAFTTSGMRFTLALVLAAGMAAGCASTAPPPSPRPATANLDDVRHVVVVASGDGTFAVAPGGKAPGREFDEVMKWLPYKNILVPIAHAVYAGIAWLVDSGRASATAPSDVAPGKIVAETFARTLQASGPFEWIVAVDREPVGEARRDLDAIIRISVPAWGLVPVREGDPELVAAFADVRAEILLPDTGVVAWQHDEDVTHPDRLPLDRFTADRALTRDELRAVLERAGRRLASELVYARGGADR